METASSWYFYASFSKYQWENSELQVIKKTPREIIPHLMEDLFYLRQYLSLESMTLLFHLSLNSIVIAFWVGLAAFVTFLFLILLYMSRSGSTPVKQVIVGNQVEESSSNGEQPHCDDLSSPYSDVVASQSPTSLSDETGIHGRI
ncbi:melanocortin-2 receptor accessory protein isoform 2-T2 [Spheniscus humboldti]